MNELLLIVFRLEIVRMNRKPNFIRLFYFPALKAGIIKTLIEKSIKHQFPIQLEISGDTS